MGTLRHGGRLLVESLEHRTLLSADASLNGDWPTFGASPAHTGYFAGTVGTQPLVEDWSLAANTTVNNGIAVADGRVYVAQSPSLTLKAYDANTGSTLWSHSFTAGNSLNAPTYYNGRIYIQRGNHTPDTQLWALDATNGNTVWSTPFTAQWESYYAPAVSDQGIWIDGGYYGGMYGFRADGTQIAFVNQAQYDQWTPSLSGNNVYAYVEGKLSKYSTTDGSLVWSNTHTWDWAGWSMNTISALDSTQAYVVGRPNLYAIDLSTGATSWTVTGSFTGSPAVAAGTVYANSGMTVKAYDAATGAAGLTYTADQSLVQQPIITDDAVIATSVGKTYVFSRSTGALLQSVPYGGELAVANNHLYIASSIDHSLHTYVFAKVGNNAPVTSQDEYTFAEDTTVKLDVLANDSDADNDPLRVRDLKLGPARHGTVTINDDGTLTYTPQKDFYGTDSFIYTAIDGRGGETAGNVYVHVTPVNDLPVASSFTKYIPTAPASPITLSATDVDGDALTYTITTPPQHGTITGGTGPSRTFTPTAGYTGIDAIGYVANDGTANGTPGVITLYIDDAPVAQDSTANVDEDTSELIPMSVGDPNQNAMTYRISVKPTHGTAVIQGSSILYTPTANYFGTDSISFIANDGILDSNTGKISITVFNVNETPVAKNDFFTALPGQMVISPNLLLNDSDSDGGAISMTGVTQPKHGAVSVLQDGRVAYTGDANFDGVDSFNYSITDGQGGNATATVNVALGQPSLPGDWATFGNGAAHTGYFPGSIVGGTLVNGWNATVTTQSLNQVAVANGRVYVTPYTYFGDTFLAAYDVQTGAQSWRHAFTSAYSINPPTYDAGNVYVQRGDNGGDTQLWSINSATGATVWSANHAAQWERYMAPTIADGGIFVDGGTYGGMYGFNQSNGTQRFFVTKPQVDGWTPTYYNAKVYTNVNGVFTQHNPLTGAVDWSLSTSSTNPVAAIANGFAYATGSTLSAINLNTHTTAWQVTGSFSRVPAVANGIVYAINGSLVLGFDATTGALVQTYKADAVLSSQQPIVTDDGLLVSSSSATYLFDLASGTLLQKIAVGGAISLANGVLYIADGAGVLHTYSVQAPTASATAPDLDAASDTGSSSTDNITTVNTPAFSGSGAAAGGTVALFVDGLSVGTTTADGNGNWHFTVPSALSEGAHRIAAGLFTSAGTATSTLNFTVDRTAPTAKPGGVYSVNEGASTQLNGSASSDAFGIAGIQWDFDYDGATFNTDAVGATPTFSAANLDGPLGRTLAIRVTDLAGNVSLATTSLTVANVAPTATFSNSGPVTVGSSASVSFTNSSDVAADTAAGFLCSYDFNNDGVFDVTDSTSSTATVPASYLSTTGSKIIAARITDKDGDYTNYTTAITVNPVVGGSISGTVFNDANNNAKRDSGEAGIAGITVYNDANNNSNIDVGEKFTTTDANGLYTLSGLSGGSYKIREILQSGWVQTIPANNYGWTITLATNQQLTGKDFGTRQSVTPPPTGGSIAGAVWNDLDGDAVKDSNEVGVANITIYNDANNNSKLDSGEKTTVTDASGDYILSGLSSGSYKIRQILQSGWSQTSPANGYGWTITLASNQQLAGKNFGTKGPVSAPVGSVAGTVYIDSNDNGSFDSGETPLSGHTVFIDLNGNLKFDSGEPNATSDAQGHYVINNVPAGTLIVMDPTQPNGLEASAPPLGYQFVGMPAEGFNFTNVDFGFAPPNATISGVVYLDSNKNGTQDSGEAGVANVRVYLDANNNGALDSGEQSMLTASDGTYQFGPLLGGDFYVREIVPGGYIQTAPASNGAVYFRISHDSNAIANFGIVTAPTGGSIAGMVWNDLDGDRVKDNNEVGVANITVYNDANNNSKLDSGEKTTTTDANGDYVLSGLASGSYKIREILQSGWTQTTPTNNYGWTITLASNQQLTGKNFGTKQSTVTPPPTGGTISGAIFNDLDGDGQRDSNEVGVGAGWTVYIDLDNDSVLDSNEVFTTTDANGNWTLSGLAAGTYKVRQVLQSGWKQTTPTNNYGLNVTLSTNQSVGGKLFGSKKIA